MTHTHRRLNIGILSARFPPVYCGGAELQAAGVARHLAERHNVSVFTRDGGDPTVVDAWKRHNIRVYPRRVVPFPLRPVADLFTGLRELRRHRDELDVILAYQVYIDGLLGVMARAVLGIPVAVSIQSEIEIRSDLSVRSRLVSRSVLKSADCITAQSPRLHALVDGFLGGAGQNGEAGRHVVVVPNGVDQEAPSDEDRSGVVFVGRLVRRKGIEDLIDAVTQLDGTPLTVVGDGPEAPRLKERAKGVPVEFVGRVTQTEVRHYLRRAALFVLPATHGEGVPNAIMEAMACGVPVVATRNAGVPDIIQNGESGMLVTPGHPAELAHAIRCVLDDPRLWQRLSDGGRAVARQFNWDAVMEIIERMLMDVVDRNAGRAG